MTDDLNKMSCAEFQAQLAGADRCRRGFSQHPHLKSCELCRALLADLETIAEAARQLFPDRGTARRGLGTYRIGHQGRGKQRRWPIDADD